MIEQRIGSGNHVDEL